jgi:hypothetical protein
MKYIYILLIYFLSILNLNGQIINCDSTLQLNIIYQNLSETNITLNQVNSLYNYSYIYWNIQGQCVGGTTSSNSVCFFGQGGISDSTILWLQVADTSGSFCYVIDTLIFNNSIWSFMNGSLSCIDSSLIDPFAFCPMIYNPVCGCNGITYDNDCKAEILGGVTSWTSGPCLPPPSFSLICEDFESLTVGDPIAENSPSWNTWGELINGTSAPFSDDANVTNILANSGTNSLYFEATGIGGPQDVVLPFGTGTPYTTGDFVFSANFFVKQGTGAYFNFQAENIPGTTWSLDVQMDALGSISFQNGGGATVFLTDTYPMESWFELKLIISLTNNNWEVFIDGISIGFFSNSVNQIASLDLYPIQGHQFYVDDVCYSHTPIILENLNGQVSSITPITGLAGQDRYPSVEVRNLGLTNITSFDIDFNYNGIIITENISAVNMVTLDVFQVNFTTPIVLIGGNNLGTATIYNVNNLGQDDDPSDDNMITQINSVIPAQGKLVIGEEATGTWCGFCPRGSVALNWMDKDYKGYWQGIAVHNGDPMTDPIYDNGIASYISGYPSGLVDRGSDINPAAFKQDFLQRIIIEPSVKIINGAELNGSTLKINLTTIFTNSVSGNYKIACVLVEDSVTGSSSDYSQNNSYSGGGYGPLIDVDGTDWANKPPSVPASQMVYRDVARGVAPSFMGENLSNTVYSSGDTETHCFEFILDPSWDQSKIHIVGMLLDNNNRVDNASSTTIIESIAEGYNSCATSIFGIDLNGPDRINIYPIPSTETIYISNLNKEAIIKIYDSKGGLVLENKISDKQNINISSLAIGVYQIKFEGDNWSETRRLIKE